MQDPKLLVKGFLPSRRHALNAFLNFDRWDGLLIFGSYRRLRLPDLRVFRLTQSQNFLLALRLVFTRHAFAAFLNDIFRFAMTSSS
jgi:hypothetical protein